MGEIIPLFDDCQRRTAAFFGGIVVVVGRGRGVCTRGAGDGGQGGGGGVGDGCGGRIGGGGVDFEGHALAVFVGVDGQDVLDGDVDFARDAAEAGVEVDGVVVHFQAGGGAEADVEDDFALLDVFHRDRRGGVDLHSQVGREAAVGAPFVNGAQHVRFGRNISHDCVL